MKKRNNYRKLIESVLERGCEQFTGMCKICEKKKHTCLDNPHDFVLYNRAAPQHADGLCNTCWLRKQMGDF